MADSSCWKPVVHGKIVVGHTDGPIVPGATYGWNGRSADISDEVIAWCRPSRLSVTEGNFGWRDYPWMADGGFLLVPRCIDGTWYQLAGCIRPRSEAGEGQPKRLYTQANYLVRRVLEDSHAILEIPQDFSARPLTEAEAVENMADVPARTDDLLLEGDDWLERAAPHLIKILSGQRSLFTEGTPEDARRDFEFVSICLPNAIRWRVAFGCGFARIPDYVHMGHGVAAPQTAETSRFADVGPRYLKWLRKLLAGELDTYVGRDLGHQLHGATFSHRKLDEALQLYLGGLDKWNVPSPQPVDFQKLPLAELGALLDSWDQVMELGNWVIEPNDRPPLRRLPKIHTGHAAEIILLLSAKHNTAVPCTPLISQFKDLPEIIREILARSKDRPEQDRHILEGWLVICDKRRDVPGGLERFCQTDLPAFLSDSLVKRLRDALLLVIARSDNTCLSEWREIVLQAGKLSASNWLAAFEQEFAAGFPKLLLRLSPTEMRCWLGKWERPGPCQTLSELLDGESPARSDLEVLARTMVEWQREEDATMLVQRAWQPLVSAVWDAGAPVAALYLAERMLAVLESDNDSRQLLECFHKTSKGNLAAINQRAGKYGWHHLLIRQVLWNYQHIQGLSGHQQRELQHEIGRAAAYILFGFCDEAEPSSADDQATKHVQGVIRSDAAALGRAVEYCGRFFATEPEIEQTIATTLREKTACASLPPTGELVHKCLRHQKIESLPELSAAEARFVTSLLPKEWMGTQVEAPCECLGELRARLAIATSSAAFHGVDDRLFFQAWEASLTADDDSEFWSERVESLEAQDHWRLLLQGLPPEKLDNETLKRIDRLSAAARFRLLELKWPLTSNVAPGLKDFQTIQPDMSEVQFLVNLAKRSGWRWLSEVSLAYILTRSEIASAANYDRLRHILQPTWANWCRQLVHRRPQAGATTWLQLASQAAGCLTGKKVAEMLEQFDPAGRH